jgi:hypothetical protein
VSEERPLYVTAAPRNGTLSMLPTTWQGRSLWIEYTGADGVERMISGKYLADSALGLILGANGSRTLIAWSALATVELVEDG